WFEAKQARLPEGAVVVSSEAGHMLWRPWTLVYPMPLAYTVHDAAHMQTEEAVEGRIARFMLYRFEKKHLTSTVKSASYQLLCNQKVMFRLNEAGQAKFETQTELASDTPLYQAICPA